jgi:hypothetical protein
MPEWWLKGTDEWSAYWNNEQVFFLEGTPSVRKFKMPDGASLTWHVSHHVRTRAWKFETISCEGVTATCRLVASSIDYWSWAASQDDKDMPQVIRSECISFPYKLPSFWLKLNNVKQLLSWWSGLFRSPRWSLTPISQAYNFCWRSNLLLTRLRKKNIQRRALEATFKVPITCLS